MTMKKFMALALALVMVFALTACADKDAAETTGAADTTGAANANESTGAADTTGAADATDAPAVSGEGKTVGICIYKFDDNFMTIYREALQKDLEAAGYKVTVVDGKNDQSTQTEQINTFISQGVDALIVNPVQTTAADAIVSQVKDAGIPTVFINREPNADIMEGWDQISYVGCDAAQSGTFQGNMILDTETAGDINGDGTISYIMIQGDPENIDAKLRTEYSVKALTDAGKKVKELDLQRGDWDQNKGQEICANDLSKFGEEIEVVFCNNDAMALGALEAIKAAGRTVGKDIYLVGVDALSDALAQVQNGMMTGTVLNDAKGQAAKAIEVMEMLLNGKPVEKQYYVDYVKVTPENAASFIG